VSLTNASRIRGTAGVLALLVTLFLASDAMAQGQYCECYDSVRTVSVRRAPVRRAAYRVKARRTYRTAHVRRVYQTTYIPTTRVASYVADEDYGEVDENYVYRRYDTERIARGWGHRDGFKDGWKAALKHRDYNARNSGDFRDANNGYKRRFGSKYVYKSAYRQGYVKGYDTGYRSVAGDEQDGVLRY
jgi:hypothetical protein